MNVNSIPLISIIIPTYNRKSDLIRAIDSVISQSYTNWELIIVDNNSTDKTINFTLKFKKEDLGELISKGELEHILKLVVIVLLITLI